MRCSNSWGHYVRDFVTSAWLLRRLTEKGSLSHWTPACEQAFADLKGLLVSAPILAFRDFLTPFILNTEASSNGFGAVLSQFGDDGTEHVGTYGGHSLSKTERQYCVTWREPMVVVEYYKHFSPYPQGCQFQLRTDYGSFDLVARILGNQKGKWHNG